MLLKISEFMQPSNNLAKQWKGVIKDVNDPLKLGRVKCLILGLTSEDADIDSLPWVARQNPPGLGGAADSSEFAVPELDSEVIIVFPTKDIYFPVYIGAWHHSLTHQVDFNEDYPNTYGWRDATGNIMRINKAKKTAEFIHATGSAVKFGSDGGITITSKRKVRFESEDGQTTHDFDMQTGGTKSNPKAETEQGGAAHAVTAKQYREDIGSKNQIIKGIKSITIEGSEKKQIGGDSGTNIIGNKAETIGGDTSALYSGKTEATYGLGKKESVVLGDVITELLLGNYEANIIAGNVVMETKAGTVDIKNLIGAFSLDIAGNLTAKGLLATIEATAICAVKGALIKLGEGSGPVVTSLTSPLVDNITGVPQIGVPTVLA